MKIIENTTFTDILLVSLASSSILILIVSFELIYHKFKKSIQKKRDNTEYKLYVDDIFIGKMKLKACKIFYDEIDYEFSKGNICNKDTKEYKIYTR